MWKSIKSRSWLSIDSNNELGMGNSVPEEKRNNDQRRRQKKQIKYKLGCRTAWDKTLSAAVA